MGDGYIVLPDDWEPSQSRAAALAEADEFDEKLEAAYELVREHETVVFGADQYEEVRLIKTLIYGVDPDPAN